MILGSESYPYDVIVVGAGHAGSEAAAAAATLGCSTLLVTMNLLTIGQMSCNPAMGGVAKGQIVREIDALGGRSGLITDRTAVQWRMLNRSKGPAMWSPRAQSDRARFAEAWRLELESIEGLDFWQDMVAELIVGAPEVGSDVPRVQGVVTGQGKRIYGRAVVLTNGTFLNGILHTGKTQTSGGRSGERAATGLTEQLHSLGFESGRMKTGTPPRLDGRSLDYAAFEVQPGDQPPGRFSYAPAYADGRRADYHDRQLPCHIAYTTPEVHRILETGFHDSPMFTGRIQGIGPRYCPSIEDKIVRFADKDRHQLFIEPEGWQTVEIYLNGFSSSLPEAVQYEALRHIPGFERVKMFRAGYAIEYDYFPPHQLRHSLETRAVAGLYFAGQINGTTGYEEAAAQGLMAGLNAARRVRGEAPIVLGRDQAYIGVLIDDLITKGTDEPYRMFTSRAEYRILLRQDNADARLTELGHRVGLASAERAQRYRHKRAAVEQILKALGELSLEPAEAEGFLIAHGEAPIRERQRLKQLLGRPGVNLPDLRAHVPALAEAIAQACAGAAPDQADEVVEQAEITVKYAGYEAREREQAAKLARLEGVPLPERFDYDRLPALSNEAKQKLARVRPSTLGQASRISGVSPSDISVLLVHLGR